ncbi:PhnD/SsuA/transferrin family substrate-binding protein [Neptunomonas sp.]|uniref:phosphate/phosphite/phosphonate ABC transporter substrate-binding protein n=1 Tax=Neptunomonas sp. TaxID=1971898 RepID=UPI0025DD1924|nr:PhnD/SsuA/transferrin family substrate-binding protein [Neptunomonas sp.]
MSKRNWLVGLFVSLYVGMLSAGGVNSSGASGLNGGLSMYINAAEGGDISDRRLSHLQDYFQKRQCNIQVITAGHKSAGAFDADIVFMPLKQEIPAPFQKVFGLSVVDDQFLSASLLVRSSTGINDLTKLGGVRIAFLSPNSVTGFYWQKKLLHNAGVMLKKDLITFTNSNLGAMSLLLHKDVFAAGVATPLAKKWAKANDLTIVAESPRVETGGLWMKRGVAQRDIDQCKKLFKNLFENNSDRAIKKLVKVFPVWVDGFVSVAG